MGEVEKCSRRHVYPIERIYPRQGHDHGGVSWPKAIPPCARAEPTGDSSAPLMLAPHFLWHPERDPHLGLSWAFDQLPVRRPPALRKGHFPALPCVKEEEPNWAGPTTVRSPLTFAHPTCAVSGASPPSSSFGLQSQRRCGRCDIGRLGGEFVVEESSEAVERTPSTPHSIPQRCAPAPQPMSAPSGRHPPRL